MCEYMLVNVICVIYVVKSKCGFTRFVIVAVGLLVGGNAQVPRARLSKCNRNVVAAAAATSVALA